MNRQLNMRHLHLGCGESLSQWLAEALQRNSADQPQPARPRLQPVNGTRGNRKGGGHR